MIRPLAFLYCDCGGRYPDWPYHSALGCGRTEENYRNARQRTLRWVGDDS